MIKNVNEIKGANLLDIVSRYVELKKEGSHYSGLCPFHEEKTPSFKLDTNKQLYHCFGCQEGGNNPVQFLMDKEQLSFVEAAEEVARLSNIKVEYVSNSNRAQYLATNKIKQDQKKRLWETMSSVKNWYSSQLEEALEALQITDDDYIINCAGRTYQYRTLKTFQISYATADNQLAKNKANFDQEALKELSVLKPSDSGLYDFFRDRLLFPITDHRGQVLAFGGRKPQNDTNKKNPKYLNSPESPIYKKSNVLYGIHQAKGSIHRQDHVWLVEGYTDVLTLHENDIKNVVATCGTALSEGQIALLKRYSKNVYILRDGDSAGLAAAQKDVDILIKNGCYPKIAILDQGDDPDSFLRKHKSTGFAYFVEEKLEDALIWRIMQEWDEKTPIKKESAFKLAGELIAHIESESLRSTYIKELCSKKRMGPVLKILKDHINYYQETLFKPNQSQLTQAQQKDVINFGIYSTQNRYYVANTINIEGIQISNFTIDPIYLIIGAHDSQRLIKIENEYGRSAILNIPAASFTTLNEFKKEVERMGNYLFTGKTTDFDRIKSKIYANTPECFPLNIMGWNKKGFYVWGNGISHKGQFTPIDENGIIEFEDTRYFLPAFSKMQDYIHSDDMEEQFEFEKKFCYHMKPKSIDFKSWVTQMIDVHGWNGAMGVAFAISSLFRDIIFPKFNFFPLLNCFGPSGSGKSFFARSLMALFGQSNRHDPFNLASGTPVAFKRKLAQAINAVVFFDEYSNSIDFRRVEALKGSYDGAGHEKGIKSNDHRTITTKIRSAIILAGQQQPTQDIALFKRVIALNFSSSRNSLEAQIKAKKLKEIEESGQLTQLTQYLLTMRDQIDQHFSGEFEVLRARFYRMLKSDGHEVEDRIINNHLIPLTIMYMINARLEAGINIVQFEEWCYNNVIQQSESIFSEDELSIFWRILEYLHDKGINDSKSGIHHYQDLIVEEKAHERYQNEADKKDRKDSLLKTYEQKTTLLYIRFSRIHPEYQDRHQKQRGKAGLDLQALQYYLRASAAYEGQKRAKKFGDKAYSCYVFKMEELAIELPLSIINKEV
ncbi:MAG: DNA primase [Saprospiraceae bacterium]